METFCKAIVLNKWINEGLYATEQVFKDFLPFFYDYQKHFVIIDKNSRFIFLKRKLKSKSNQIKGNEKSKQ